MRQRRRRCGREACTELTLLRPWPRLKQSAQGSPRAASNQAGGRPEDGTSDSEEQQLWQQKRQVARRQQRQQLEGSAHSLKQRHMLHRLEAIEDGSNRPARRPTSSQGGSPRRGRRADTQRRPGTTGPGTAGHGARAAGAHLVSRLAAESFAASETAAEGDTGAGRGTGPAAGGGDAGGTAPARIAAFRESLRLRALGRTGVRAQPKDAREAPLLGANRTAEQERPWRTTAAALSPNRGPAGGDGGGDEQTASPDTATGSEGGLASPQTTAPAAATSAGDGARGGDHPRGAEEVGGAMLARRRRPYRKGADRGLDARTPPLATGSPQEHRSVADRIKVRRSVRGHVSAPPHSRVPRCRARGDSWRCLRRR